jgi:hypothetical protein
MTPNTSGATDKFFTGSRGTYFRERESGIRKAGCGLSFCKIQVPNERKKHEGTHLDWTERSDHGDALREPID